MPSLNLKAKFAIVTGTMILTVAMIITTFLTRQQEQTIREELVHRAVALADNLAYNCQLPLVMENRPSLQRLASGLLKAGEVSYVQFQNARGVRLLQAGEVQPDSLQVVRVHEVHQHANGALSAWIYAADGRTFLDVHTVVTVQGQDDDVLSTGRQAANARIGQVRVGMTTEPAEKRIARMRVLAGLIGLAIALAGSLLAAALIRVMTRPLKALMEGNRRVGRGDFSLRLEVRTRDEFARLARSYNQMADEIQRSRELAESYLESLRANAENLEEANRALQHTNAELAKASRMKSEFLATMSHELRTPLNVVIGFSEVLLDKSFGELNPKQERYASNIMTSGRHLLTLINDILDLSKVEAGKAQVMPSPFDLRQTFEEIHSLVRPLAGKKHVQISCGQVPDGTPSTDQRLFKQVMFNLLSNAIKFTPEGGQVSLAVRDLDGAQLRDDPATHTLAPERRQAIPRRPLLLVEVRDSGIGIAPEDYDKIFVAFQQVDASYARDQEGTGLGLALSRKIVQLLGGDIWFSSRRGEGSCFSFYVPSNYTLEESGAGEPQTTPRADSREVSVRAQPAPLSGPPGSDAPSADRIARDASWPWGTEPPKPAPRRRKRAVSGAMRAVTAGKEGA